MTAEYLHAEKKENFIGTREDIPNVAQASPEEIEELIKKDPAYGNVICRCETVTEGEIVNAIRPPLGCQILRRCEAENKGGNGQMPVRFLRA